MIGTQPAGRRKWLYLALLTLGTVLLDQLTKAVVTDRFRLGETFPVVANFFSLTYIRNTGAAFGLLAHAPPAFRIPFFVIVPLAALIAIALIFRKIPANDFKLSSALSLVIGGAVGNLVDRVRFGYVVDFLDFHWRYEYHFPAFNVADSAICIGVGILMLDLLTQDAREPVKAALPAQDPGSEQTGATSAGLKTQGQEKETQTHASSSA